MLKGHILVVGGAGFIGSHINAMLHRSGYSTVVLDNLSRGHRETVIKGNFIEGDLADPLILEQIFSTYSIQAVMHFAALADIGESMQHPQRYYQNNVANTLNLLNAMQRHKVKFFIFSSSAAIFGIPITNKIAEDHPCRPITPYGHTKLIVETILKDYESAYGIKSCCLRYFNAAGGDPCGEVKYYPRREFNIIPKVFECLDDPTMAITINGTDYSTFDGTCVRDYIHPEDIGAAHITALEQLLQGVSSNSYNLGNEQGFSVRQIITAIEKVTGQTVRIKEGPRRLGDPPILVADATKAQRELGWQPRYNCIETMITHAWQARR